MDKVNLFETIKAFESCEAAALAALAADAPVTVSGSQCVQKSYPAFWDDFNSLKGETPCPAPSEAPSV